MKKTFNLKKLVSVAIAFLMVLSMAAMMPVNAITYYTITYKAGDADNIVGSSEYSMQKISGSPFEVASSTTCKFTRNGYKLISWNVPSTGETVAGGASYTMPANDVTFIANWQPVTYSVGFAGTGGKTSSGASNVYLNATYGSVMTLPENPFTYNGYQFVGWKYNGNTYHEGELFSIPPLVSGSKIIFAAVWDPYVEPEETTTTEITDIEPPPVTTGVSQQTSMKSFYINEKISCYDENTKTYRFPLDEMYMLGLIEKIEVSISSDSYIGQASLSLGAAVDDEWKQKEYNEYFYSRSCVLEFLAPDECNKINGDYFQVGYWWGSNENLTIDSIIVTYRPWIISGSEGNVTTPETTTVTTTETTTETTTTTTTETTAETTTTETTTETTIPTQPTETTTTVSYESCYSKTVYPGIMISRGNNVSIPSADIVDANQVIESIEFTFRTYDSPIYSYSMSASVAGKNNNRESFNYSEYSGDYSFVLDAEIPEYAQDYVSANDFINIGYWWGSSDVVYLESVKINYHIKSGDFNHNGIVGNDDVEALRKYMVGVPVYGYDIDSKSGDINGDGVIDVFDYMLLSRLV